MFVFNLAPLQVRRQIAMLGVIHRSVLGLGPAQLQAFFQRAPARTGHATRAAGKRHDKQLIDIRDGRFLEIQRRSALGLIWIYNRLPGSVVSEMTVSGFQHQVQEMVKERASSGCTDWLDTP